MSRNYKNRVLHDHISIGEERRKALAKEALKDSSPFPNTLTYEDIDREFKRWVEEDLDLSFEGKKLPTMVLYSNQKFSEFKQSWEFTDDKHNLILNFKTITRDVNPKQGSINGDSKNIPGDRRYTMKKVLTQDEAGRNFFTIYKMKQPFGVDLSYKVGLITNKIELINEFNQLIQDKFKAIDCYIRPNGHYIALKLEDIADDSELSLDDREFYSQTYNITVKAYIIDETSFEVTEEPVLKLSGIDTMMSSENKTSVDVEEYEDNDTSFIVKLHKNGEGKTKFISDCNMLVTGITVDNITSMKLLINGDEIETHVVGNNVYTSVHYDENGIQGNEVFEDFIIKEDSEIRVKKVSFDFNGEIGKININGKTFQKEE